MENIDQFVSSDLRTAIQRFGFNKVAAQMYGVDEISEKTAAEILGTKLMTRLAEERVIRAGLSALRNLGG